MNCGERMSFVKITEFINVKFGLVSAHVFSTQIKNIIPVAYVAARGQSEEAGAVQRVLNKRRISSIARFVAEGNTFYTPIFLNWTNTETIHISDKEIKFSLSVQSAQVIDGQHRLEGIKQAIKTNSEIEEKELLIVLTKNLSTQDAAKIFLNINTEQRPVPKSLVYDLFSDVKDKNSYEMRLNDLAKRLNDDEESPYYKMIKMPGVGIGKVDLSIVISSLKPYISEGSTFEKYNINDFESQYKILLNYYSFLRNEYDKQGLWNSSKNPFLTNAGIYASVEFLCKDLIAKCVEARSFEIETIESFLPLESQGLLLRDDIKNLQGKEQRSEIYKYLLSAIRLSFPDSNEYKF